MRPATAAAVGALLTFAGLVAGCTAVDRGSGGVSGPDGSSAADGAADAGPPPNGDGGSTDAGEASADAGGDAGEVGDAGTDGGDGAMSDACAPFGAPGECMPVSSCAALGDHTSYPGYCPGPTDIECCIVTPSTANNPPVPAGWALMQQSQVTSAMTTWAVMILDDPTTYAMFSTTTMTFGTQLVLARVEWHPPDSNNETVHRGVTLYEPAD